MSIDVLSCFPDKLTRQLISTLYCYWFCVVYSAANVLLKDNRVIFTTHLGLYTRVRNHRFAHLWSVGNPS